jgi:hypothetical protein
MHGWPHRFAAMLRALRGNAAAAVVRPRSAEPGRPAGALLAHARCRLALIDGLQLQADAGQPPAPCAGVVSFVLRQQPSAAVAAVLAAEFGISVQHSHGAPPDGVRLALGPQHTHAEVDALADALQKIARGEFNGVYTLDSASGDYVALGTPPRATPGGAG